MLDPGSAVPAFCAYWRMESWSVGSRNYKEGNGEQDWGNKLEASLEQSKTDIIVLLKKYSVLLTKCYLRNVYILMKLVKSKSWHSLQIRYKKVVLLSILPKVISKQGTKGLRWLNEFRTKVLLIIEKCYRRL